MELFRNISINTMSMLNFRLRICTPVQWPYVTYIASNKYIIEVLFSFCECW